MLQKVLIVILSIVLINGGVVKNNSAVDCNLPEDLIKEIASYSTIVKNITETAVNGSFKGLTYNELATFIDKFGNRLAGTENLENAIDYMLKRLKYYNLDDVHGERVEVPYWQRGEEKAILLEPMYSNLAILGLGSSIGTPSEGITAEAIVVRTFEELQKLGKKVVNGKIVVFNEKFISYGKSVKYRSRGAVEAAKLGGVAVLISSITPKSLYTLHTGWQDYNDSVTKIPSASITVEDAHMLQRMYDRGSTIKIHLKMTENDIETKISRNTIGAVNGRTNSEQFVIISGHLDSWDVGRGAMDDGGGAFISWVAVALLKKLGLNPRRTVRAVLWTGEEEGYYGAVAYNKSHPLENFNFVIESDEGTFEPFGIEYNTNTDGGCILKEILKLLSPIGTTQAIDAGGRVGSDIEVWQKQGISAATLHQKDDQYFWYHHSEADTMKVEKPENLDKGMAIFAAVSYVIADLSIDFPKINDPNGEIFKKFQEN